MKTVIKGWGYEVWVENNELYCCKHLHILPEKQCSLHYHRIKDEVFYILNGELRLDIYEDIDCIPDYRLSHPPLLMDSIILKKGESYRIHPRIPHRFTSNTSYPCDFIEASTHHDDADSYRIMKGD